MCTQEDYTNMEPKHYWVVEENDSGCTVSCQGFEDLDIKASGQIAASVQNMRRVLELSLQAWNSIPIRVFQASWIVTGYFESSHFPPIDQTPSDIGAAQKVLDPAGVSGGSLPGTPQFCHKYEWQVQDC